MGRNVDQHGAPRIPCVIYAAKSTEDTRGSIGTQIDDCRAAIARQGGREIEGEPLTDENHSAYSANRGPGLAEAKLRAAESARAHGEAELWVQHSDRLARGDGRTADHLAEIFFAMRRQNVRLRSVQDDANLEDVIRVALIGERNSEDSRRKSDAVKAGKRRQFERGEPLGGPIPDGYVGVPEVVGSAISVRRQIDPDRAPLIRRIFALADAGVAPGRMARQLNREGLRTANGVPWTRRRLQDLLTNPHYAGRVARGRGGRRSEQETAPGNFPPLVDPEQFDRVQRLFASRDRAAGSARTPGRPNARHLLARLAHCARCGQPMRPQISTYVRKDGTRRRTYVCGSIHAGTGLCALPLIDAEAVDRAVLDQMHLLLADLGVWAQDAASDAAARRAELVRAAEIDRAALSELRRAEGALADRYADAVAADDEADAYAASLAVDRVRRRAERVAARIAELTTDTEDGDTELSPVDRMLDYFARLRTAVAGHASGQSPLVDVNQELRELFVRFDLDIVDGEIAIVPVPNESAIDPEPRATESRPGSRLPAILLRR